MNITVFIKQVPDTDDVKWTANNNIDRTQMECIMNPEDKQAIEAALQIKEKINSYISVVTMGPEKAKTVLKEAIAMGVDNAILLCDSKFAGSDTLATSKILTASIKELFPDTDLIITGQTAIDGETGQTGFGISTRLNIPFVSNVSEIIDISDNDITVISNTENKKITHKIEFPTLICIHDFSFKPRVPKIQGYINAQNSGIKTYNLYDLNLKEEETGIKGSPTYVSKVYKNSEERNGKILDFNEQNIKELYKEIKKEL